MMVPEPAGARMVMLMGSEENGLTRVPSFSLPYPRGTIASWAGTVRMLVAARRHYGIRVLSHAVDEYY